MKRKLNKIRVAVLKLITTIATIALLIAGCALDSESKLPLIICSVCLGWLLLIFIANKGDDW